MRGIGAAAVVVLLSGCCGSGPRSDDPREVLAEPPGARLCCVLGHDYRMVVPGFQVENLSDAKDLLDHHYGGGLSEDNGIFYTCRGGFVDTGHVREHLDRTAWLAEQLRRKWRGRPSRIELPREAGRVTLHVYSTHSRPSRELLLRIAQRVAFDFGVWHEIATWYGSGVVGDYSEQHSSFSPEDLTSNAFGVLAGANALRRMDRDPELTFDQAASHELRELLARLHPISPRGTRQALDAVEGPGGWWDKRKRVPNNLGIRRRYVDPGPSLSPWLIPDPYRVCERPGTHSHSRMVWRIPTRGPGGESLTAHCRLEIAVDRGELEGLPLPANRTITPEEFGPILTHVRTAMRRELGPLACRPDPPATLQLDDGKLLTVYRSGDGAWQVRTTAPTHRGWRVLHQRAFGSSDGLRDYLYRSPSGLGLPRHQGKELTDRIERRVPD